MRLLAATALAALTLLLPSAVRAKGAVYTDPDQTDADYAVQGEYLGEFEAGPEGKQQLGLQIIALGKGEFEGVGYKGALPGAGWDGKPVHRVKGTRQDDGSVVFLDPDKAEQAGKAVCADGKVSVYTPDGKKVIELKKVERKSPTLGQAPPEGAVVLFDGTNVDQWKNGQMSEDKLLMQGVTSNQTFGSHQLHIEFRLPYQPEDRGQGQGNSGIYLQGRYECQMLDSFGLSGEQNECGGLYSVKKPDVNMCLPPLTWQTYDIEYTAAKYDGDKLVANPRVTIRHNGVVIHDDVELPGERNTTAAPVKAGPQKGPVYLQNHGNPVRYRNIWVVEK